MKFIDFAFIIGKLKRLKRSGWVNNNIKNPESVADHSFRMAVLAMVIAPLDLDELKTIKMALIHDIGEAEIGDIINKKSSEYLQNREKKIIAERKAIENIFSLIDKKEYVDLFNEFEENKTKEAKFVRNLDKLEMVMQALEYEKEQKINLQEFFDDVKLVISDDYLKEIFQKIKKFRAQPEGSSLK